jgi:hypothetical protein
MKIILLIAILLSVNVWADPPVAGEFRVTGVVKRLDGDAVVLRIKNRNIRLSRRFFEDRDNLTVGEVGKARYTMTFKSFGSRKPSSN